MFINVNCLWVPSYDVIEICTENLCYKAQKEDVPRVYSLQVEFTGQKNELALNLLMCKSLQTKCKIRLRKGGKCRTIYIGVQMGVQTWHLPLLRIFFSYFALFCT